MTIVELLATYNAYIVFDEKIMEVIDTDETGNHSDYLFIVKKCKKCVYSGDSEHDAVKSIVEEKCDQNR